MRIKDVKTSSYDTVNQMAISYHIKDDLKEIEIMISENPALFNLERSKLKRIAANIETAKKLLEYTITGIY